MISWNYRVIRQKHFVNGRFEYSYAIREVYYNEDESIWAISAEPMAPGGETFMELDEDLKHMREALSLPLLMEEDIKFVNKEVSDEDGGGSDGTK